MSSTESRRGTPTCQSADKKKVRRWFAVRLCVKLKNVRGWTNLIGSTESKVEVVDTVGRTERRKVEHLGGNKAADDGTEAETVLPRVAKVDDVNARSTLRHRAAPQNQRHLAVLHGHTLCCGRRAPYRCCVC